MSTRNNRTNRLRPVRFRLAESVAIAERVDIRETPVIEAPSSAQPGKLVVQLIKAGWSQNGRYYSEAVLKRDGAKAFPAGTLNFVDHDTDEETMARPAGSLTRLASFQTTDARWDPQRKALTAEVRLLAPWREAVTDWATSGAIGMSIRAWAEGEPGTAEGRDGMLITALTEGRSVDYVTKPAAGGAIVAVLESITNPAKVSIDEARNIGAWLESRLHLALTQLGDDMYGNGRLTREERIVLSSAIGDALKAWTSRVEADAPALFTRDLYDEPGTTERATSEAQETTPGDPPAPTEPEAAPETAPDPAPDSPTETAAEPEAPPTTDPPAETGEPTDQPGTQAEPVATEEEVQPDNPGAPTPTTPGSARQVIEAEVAEMRREVALMRAERTARSVLTAALSDGWIPPTSVANITESLMRRLPLLADGQLDEAELTKMAARELAAREQELAEGMQAAGVGRPRDLGQGGGAYTSGQLGLGAAEVERRLEESFLSLGNSSAVAKAAAKGRD